MNNCTTNAYCYSSRSTQYFKDNLLWSKHFYHRQEVHITERWGTCCLHHTETNGICLHKVTFNSYISFKHLTQGAIQGAHKADASCLCQPCIKHFRASPSAGPSVPALHRQQCWPCSAGRSYQCTGQFWARGGWSGLGRGVEFGYGH